MSTTASRPVRRLLVALALLAAPVAALAPASGASAASVDATRGSAGSIELNGPMIVATGSSRDTLAFTAQGLQVGASSASSDSQVVRVRYSAEYFLNGEWVSFNTSALMKAEVSGASEATFGAWKVSKPAEVGVARDYRILYVISWQDVVTQNVIAEATVSPGGQGEVFCATSNLSCEMLDDRVRV